MAKIYVDAGHGIVKDGGVWDCGAVGVGGLQEAVVNLAVSKYLQAELKRNGFDVKMSRTGNTTTKDVNARAKESNKWGADIYVSVHCNAYKLASANGTSTYVYKKGGNAEKLAGKVQDEMIAAFDLKDRGINEGNFAVVRDTKAPAILCELAFITNEKDCATLDNVNDQKKWAVAICKGICSYFGVTYKKEESKMKNDYSTHWAKPAIQNVVDKKIMVGDGKGNFRPNDNITRAEIAQTITNLLKYLDK